MPSFPETVGGWLLDLLGFIGLGIGGTQAAAAGMIEELQQDSLRKASQGHVFFDIPSRGRVLPIATLAEMVVKDATTMEQATDEASYSGVSPSRFETLVKATGNPPGLGELLDLWRRRIITEDQFRLGLRQGYMKDDYGPVLAQLRTQLLPLGELVAAAVQNHKPYLDAEDEAWKHGINSDDFTVMFENAGNPPGPMEMLNLWVRGEVDEATVDQALRESRLKDKYIGPLKRLAIRKIPMRTITTLVRHGAFTEDQAVQHLRQLGYTDEDARAIVASAHALTTAPHKDLSMTAVRDLFVEHAISHDEAVADLVTIGYTPQVADELLTLAALSRAQTFRRATITKVRSAFVGRKIARAAASADLDRIGVAAGERDALLTLWDLELEANVVMLTPAQIVKAVKMQALSPADGMARLQAHGYDQGDAVVLLIIGGGIDNPATAPGGNTP